MAKKDSRAQAILDLGNHLYDKRKPLDSLNQEIAWQFAPDLAEFMSPHVLGEDWASDRMDSFPEQASRQLTDQLGAMLRPEGKQWLKHSTGDDEMDADPAIAQWNEYLARTVRRGMYGANTGFVGATKEVDRFYTNFGMGVLSVEEEPVARQHLFYSSHHIKDCVWLDNQLRQVDHLHRRTKMSARAMVRFYGEKRLHEEVVRCARREPNREFEIRFVTMPADEYNGFGTDTALKTDKTDESERLPFKMCAIDVERGLFIKHGGLPAFNYVVPRWSRFSSTQYAFSPAAMTALPDGRMAQMLAQILLESGEKAIDPPIVAKQDSMVGEPSLAAGGISWVDIEHDADLKKALDVVKLDADMRVGFQMRMDLREMLSKSFFLDKLTMLTEAGAKEMTAFEVARRLEEHIRNLLPIFAPIQVEYNSRLCDVTYDMMVNMRRIDFSRMPDDMSNVDTSWQFETPVQDAESRLLVEKFLETTNVITVGMQSGASAKPVNLNRALRDAVRGVGGPATWRKTNEEMAEEQAATEQATQFQNAAGEIGMGAQVAEQAGKAGQALGIIPPPAKPGAAPQAGQPAAPAPSGAQPLQGGAVPQASAQGLPAGIDMSGLAGMLGGAGQEPAQAEPAALSAEDGKQILRMLRTISYRLDDIEQEVTRPNKAVPARDRGRKDAA